MAWFGGGRWGIIAASLLTVAATTLSAVDQPLPAYASSATGVQTAVQMKQAPPGTLTLQESGINQGYDTSQTSAATAADPLPAGFDTYVEDAHQDLAFTYIVSNHGNTALSGIAVKGSLTGVATCPRDTLAPGRSETCTAIHTTTSGDIEGAVKNQSLTDQAIATGSDDTQIATAKSKFSFTAPIYALNQAGDGPFGNCNDIAQDGGVAQSTAPSERACINHVLGKIIAGNSQPGYQNAQSPGVVDPINTPVVLDLMGGSYEVDSGLYVIDHEATNVNPETHHPDPGDNDIWIENGSLYDGAKGDNHPVISMVLGQNIYLDDLTVLGMDKQGAFEAGEYNNGAIRSDGTRNLVMNNWNAQHVYGDGINLEPFLCGHGSADCVRTVATISNVVVEHDGRCGLAPIGMTNTTISNVTILYPGMSSIDIEADSPNTVPGSLTINNLTMSGMFELNLASGHSGAITVNNWTEVAGPGGNFPDAVIWLKDNKGIKTPLHGALTINNSFLACSGITVGPYGACIVNQSGVVAANDLLNCGAWQVGNPCSPGLILNNDVIDASMAKGGKPISGTAGGWTVLNSSCVLDTSGANYGPPRYRGGLSQVTGDSHTFAAGTLCAKFRNADGASEVTSVPAPYHNQPPPPAEPAAFSDPHHTHWTMTCTEGQSCTYAVVVTGSPTPKVRTAYLDNGLPRGLKFRVDKGAPVFRGTPPKGSAGIYEVLLLAHNGAGAVLQQYTIVVKPAA